MDLKSKLFYYLVLLKTVLTELHNVWQFQKGIRWHNRKWLERLINKKRCTHGYFKTVFEELKADPGLFFAYTRMDVQTFTYLLAVLKPHLKCLRNRKNNICPEEKLAVTLKIF